MEVAVSSRSAELSELAVGYQLAAWHEVSRGRAEHAACREGCNGAAKAAGGEGCREHS